MRKSTITELDHVIAMSQSVNEWDELPMLFVVSEDGPVAMVVLDGDIFEMLSTVGPELKKSVSGVTGLILMNEGWALSSERTKDLEKVRRELYLSGRRFSDHPDAIEIKMFSALDDEGMVMRKIERGNPEPEEMPDGAQGRVPDHLRTLLMELTS